MRTALSQLLNVSGPLPSFHGWEIDDSFAWEIATRIVSAKPTTVLELGSGFSTIIIGYALKKVGKGRLISLEHSSRYLHTTQAALHRCQLTDWVTLIHAPLKPYTFGQRSWQWYTLPDTLPRTSINMLLIDGPPGYMQAQSRFPALPLLKPYLTANTVVYLDDAGRKDEQDIIDLWRKMFSTMRVEYLQSPKHPAKITFKEEV